MVMFIHLSDLHLHKSNGKYENVNTKLVVEHLIATYQGEKPVVLLTGDIVDDGRKKQYKNAVELLKPLVDKGFTVLACPGNHDYGLGGNVYTEKSQDYFRKYILSGLLGNSDASQDSVEMEQLFPMVTQVGEVMFVGLDSVVGAEDAFAHFASGEVGKKQRQKLKSILRAAPVDMNVVVYFHHHPFNRDFGMVMKDAKKVMDILASRANVVCFGHNHESQVWPAGFGMDWVVASGKSSKRTELYKFQYREISLSGTNNSVSMVTFNSD